MKKPKSLTEPAAPPRRALARPAAVGLIGLGIMGSAMSANLIQAGFSVSGHDPSAAARRRLRAVGGTPCADAGRVAAAASVLIFSLPGSTALMEASHAVCAAAGRCRVIVETSTLAIDDKQAAREMLAAAGVTLLDCPLSGTGAQARSKDLTVYASGPKRQVRQVQPVFDGFAKASFYLGEFGNGMKMKLMANLLVAVHNISTAEALLLGKRLGIDPALSVKVLAGGAGGSRMLDVRGPLMAAGGWARATMKVSTWQKDMQLIAAALAASNTAAPLFAASVPVYNAAMGTGHAEHDTAAVYAVLQRMCSATPIND